MTEGTMQDRDRVTRMLARLARRTSSGRYIAQVDGLRFIAIATVVLFHVQVRLHEAFGGQPGSRPVVHDALGALIGEGRLGVHVFFVISGFVLGLPFAAQRLGGGRPVSLPRYFLRRLTRIEPPYLASLLLFFGFAGLTGLWATDARLPNLAAGSIYAHGLTFGSHNPINPPYWTLEIEVQFYLLAPLLAFLFTIGETRTRRLVIVLMALLATTCQGFFELNAVPRLSGTVANFIQFFLVGFLLADVYIVDWHEQPKTSAPWDVVSLVGWPVFFALGLTGPQAIFGALPWLALVLFIAAFKGPRTSKLLGNRWIRTIGGMCYSIYLVHTPLLWILTHRTGTVVFDSFGTANVLLQVILLAPVVMVVSAGFFLLIEKPCMDPSWPVRARDRLVQLKASTARAIGRGVADRVEV